jgi:hypothetical protein
MAFRDAAHRGAFVRVPLPDESSEAHRDEVVRQSAVQQVELEIFGLAAEEHLRVAVPPNLFLKPTRDFPMAQQQQDAVLQERQAGRARQAEVERQVGVQLARLVLLQALGQQPLELLQASGLHVLEQADAD